MAFPPPVPLPRYGEAALADLVPSILASLGVSGFANTLSLAPSRAACVLLVDGLGAELLRDNAGSAPVLSGSHARDLTAGFPSTTATSLASLGTGLAPGQHGILGYQTEIPGQGKLLNALRWDSGVLPTAWQPEPTAFERAAAAGVSVSQVSRRLFKGSGLTTAALRGGRYCGADTSGELIVDVVDALASAPGLALAYAYVSDLDATGHHRGTASLAWRLQLEAIDRIVEELANRLPQGAVLYVTGDHGMVDIPPDSRIDADALEEQVLRDGVRLLGGEVRARHVYAEAGAEADVLAAWQERLGGAMWVVSRQEAVEAGWFGPVVERNVRRIGDVVAASYTDAGLVATKREPHESRLVGHHGSMTAAEQLVPLIALS
jgi:hypothetical protein